MRDCIAIQRLIPLTNLNTLRLLTWHLAGSLPGKRLWHKSHYWCKCHANPAEILCRINTESATVICGHFVKRNSWWRHQMETFSALLALCGHFVKRNSWWRHQMETFSALLALCALIFSLNKRLSKQSRRRRFETLSYSLWRQRNVISHSLKGARSVFRCF